MSQAELREPEYNRAYGMAKGSTRGGKRADPRPIYGPAAGKIIAKRLKDLGWSETQLARDAHVSQAAISHIVNGITKRPSPHLLMAIATVLRMTVEELTPGVTLFAVSGGQDPTSLRAEWDSFQEEFLPVLELLAEALAANGAAALRKTLGVPPPRGRKGRGTTE